MTFWYLRYPMGIIRYPHQMEEFTTYNTYIQGSHLAEVTLMPKLSCPNRLRGLDLSGNKGCFVFFGVMPYVCRQCACDKETQNINSCSLRKNPMTLPQIKVHNLEYLSLLQFCQRQAWLHHWIFIGFVFAFQVLHCKDGCNLSTAFVFLNHFCLPEKSVGRAKASQIASCFPRWFGSGSKAQKTHAIFVRHIFQMSNLSCIIGSMERWDMYRYVMFVLFCLVVIATFSWTCSFYTLDFMSFWCFFSHKEFTRLYVIILTDQ